MMKRNIKEDVSFIKETLDDLDVPTTHGIVELTLWGRVGLAIKMASQGNFTDEQLYQVGILLQRDVKR